MKIKGKKLIKISNLILILFIFMSAVSFADANSDAFAQVFKEASKQGGSIIGRVVNALYYEMLTVYRGVSLKFSQICGFMLLSFMIMNILKVILQNIERMDIYSIFKMILPGFIKNLIIGFILVTPVNVGSKLAIGGGMVGNLSSKGTLLTQFMKMIFEF